MAWKHMGNYGKYWKIMIDWRISRYRIFRHGDPGERQRLADKAAPQVTAIDILAEVGADLAFPSAWFACETWDLGYQGRQGAPSSTNVGRLSSNLIIEIVLSDDVPPTLGFHEDSEFTGGLWKKSCLPATAARLQDQWKLTPIDYAHISESHRQLPWYNIYIVNIVYIYILLYIYMEYWIEQRPNSLQSDAVRISCWGSSNIYSDFWLLTIHGF